MAQDISKHSKTFTSTLLTEDNKVYLVLKTTIFWNRYNYAEEEKIKFTKAKIELKNNKDKVIKIWNFQDVFFGKLFLSEDKKTVFIILIGRNSTKIYFLVKEGLVAISDFYSALGSPEPVVSQYARRAVALELLPLKLSSDQKGVSPEVLNTDDALVRKYAAGLGCFAPQATIELSNDVFVRVKSLNYGSHDLSARVCAIMPALGLLSAEDAERIINNSLFYSDPGLGKLLNEFPGSFQDFSKIPLDFGD